MAVGGGLPGGGGWRSGVCAGGGGWGGGIVCMWVVAVVGVQLWVEWEPKSFEYFEISLCPKRLEEISTLCAIKEDLEKYKYLRQIRPLMARPAV